MALAISPGQRPEWRVESAQLTGMIDRALEIGQERGQFTEYDASIGHKIKQIFSRSPGYAEAISRERQEFLDLCAKSYTESRLRHMVENGKPLRN